jgi:hypothetical protein
MIISVLDHVRGERMPEDLGSRFAYRAEIVEQTGGAVIDALRLWIGNPTCPRKSFPGGRSRGAVRLVSAFSRGSPAREWEPTEEGFTIGAGVDPPGLTPQWTAGIGNRVDIRTALSPQQDPPRG